MAAKYYSFENWEQQFVHFKIQTFNQTKDEQELYS